MTGIERLRELVDGINPITVVCGVTKTSYDRSHMEDVGARLRDFLADIAEQIEREMKASSEVEKMKCDPDDVSMSAYDLLSADEREAIAWVREHGGLDHVNEVWNNRSNLRRMYESERSKVERQQRHIEFVQGKCRERQGHIVDLSKMVDEMRPRLMPEGMEWLIEAWPKFEDDAPVKLGDTALIDGDADMVEAVQIWIHGKPVIYGDNGSQQLEKGERVRRPAVPASDGEPLEVGQTVWDVDSGIEYEVVGIHIDEDNPVRVMRTDGSHLAKAAKPNTLTHQRPVLDVDGVPINVGDTVYEVGENYPPFVVGRLPEPGAYRSVRVVYPSGAFTFLGPERLTHTKPEPPDSWERIEEDLGDEMAKQQCGPISPELACKLAGEFVRRCRALAEQGMGE